MGFLTFANSALLAGTALVGLPILLHLVMRRKPRLLEFPALRFIQLRHDVNRRQLQLRHLILLALRVMLIALVAVALARPSVKFSGALGSRKAPVTAALVFDTSKRMDYRFENRTRLEVAQELGLWLLMQLPEGSQVAVLDSRVGPSTFQADMGAARHRIERLETVAYAQPLTSVVGEALRLLDRGEPNRRKEVYVLTDMTRSAWPADTSGRLRERVTALPEASAYLIDVGATTPTNFSLGDIHLSSQVLSSRSPLQIQTELSAVGAGGTRSVELYLLEPDPKNPSQRKPLKRSEETIKLEAGRSRQTAFSVMGLEVGTHQGYVQIVGEDSLAIDDRRYFTVDVKPAWRLLVVAPRQPWIDARFLVEALAPRAFRRTGRAAFECTVIRPEEFASIPLQEFAAVLLMDPGPTDAATWKKLGDYAADGHGVAIFLGRNADPVDSFNEATAQEVLAGKLLRQARAPEGSLHLAPRSFEHPVLTLLRVRTGAIPWDPVFRYWQVETPASGVSVVTPMNDGKPAIIERPIGKGTVLTITTPFSDIASRNPWNLLPVGDHKWPFLLLVNGIASYLVGSGNQQLNYYAGQAAVVSLDPKHHFPSYVLTGPDNIEVRLNADPKEHALVVSATDQQGNYRVQAGGVEDGVNRGFSVNLAPDQTRLERIPAEELAKVLDPLPYRVARDREQIEMNVSTARVGREIFGFLILLAAGIMAMEHVLANRFYRE